MAHPVSVAPKTSEWVAVRVAAIVLAALQAREAARLFFASEIFSGALVVFFIVAGVVLAMLSLIRPSYEPAAPDDETPRALTRFDYKVGGAYAAFFLAVAAAGFAQPQGIRWTSAIIGLCGFVVATILGVRDLRRRVRRAPV
jgi:hypothetical protein